MAVGVLVERHRDEPCVLIARRPQEAVFGGYWEFPGGKREGDERLEDCLVREVEEELGLTVAVTARFAAVEHHYEYGHVRLFAFLCRRDGGEPRGLGVTDHRWVNVAELPSYRFPPANTPLLASVSSLLREQHHSNCEDSIR